MTLEKFLQIIAIVASFLTWLTQIAPNLFDIFPL